MMHWMRADFFNPAPHAVSELRYNIYGFNVGGPVTFGKLYNPSKTKTFFFYNMEWRKIINGGNPINQTGAGPRHVHWRFLSITCLQILTLADKTTRRSEFRFACPLSQSVVGHTSSGIQYGRYQTPIQHPGCGRRLRGPRRAKLWRHSRHLRWFPGNRFASGPDTLLNSVRPVAVDCGRENTAAFSPRQQRAAINFNLARELSYRCARGNRSHRPELLR